MTTHLSLIMPDGAELSYGDVADGTAPAVGEVIVFQRSDRDEHADAG